uniref:WAT1-related protein n=1 Tax=Fagus sylvatica TaxID=28930 RepID=A0A2N9EMA0_FAGSY
MGDQLGDYKPAMAMVGLQFIYAGLALFTRAALLQGMSPRVFVVYRQAIATLVMAPIACFTRRRNSGRISLGLRSFSLIFVTSLIGVTANQNAYFEGLYLASSTAASAMTNLIPAITFVIATILGLLGAFAVIIGLYVVLWGKAKDLEEIKQEVVPKLQHDQAKMVQVLRHKSPEKKNTKVDLEQPLLS